MTLDIAIRGASVVTPGATPRPMTLGISGERISAVVDASVELPATRTIDASGLVALPGMIDPHVHIGYSGYAGMPLDALPEHFDTESASALVGGVTSIAVTYRNAEPFEDIFEEMRDAGERNSRIDFGYSLGITNDLQVAGIPHYYEEFGVSSFKFYMVYKGEEAKATGNVYNRYDDGLFLDAIERITALPGAMAMVHPENPDIIAMLRKRLVDAGEDSLAAWTDSRPGFVEAESIRRALFLGEQVGCPVYIPHLSCEASLEVVREHRARRTNDVWVETCPHYLTHTKNHAAGALAKVNPPVREAGDIEAMWSGIAAGDVDTMGTDHCGVLRADKDTDIWSAVPGFSGMATMLPVLMTGVREQRIDLATVAKVASENTARIFNTYPRKGALQVGADADVVLVDPELTRTVDASDLRSRSDFSIYDGLELTGWPVMTMVRGVVAMQDGEITVEPGHGRYLDRRPDRVA